MVRKIVLLLAIALSAAAWFLFWPRPEENIETIKPKPLQQYSFENLRKREYKQSSIEYTQNKFFFESDGKKVSGIVTGDISKPAIILLRGYAAKEEYYPGFGTERIAKILAQNGFVTYAPDFLGYGDSDKPSSDAFEDRFLTYTAVLNLIATVHPAGIWGHSNGGQIALSVLEISGKQIPTVLWNPVSITFPYSILYYTWDNDDHGKALRKALANFENDYDTEKYSLTNYLDWITAPVLLQQGGADESVPQKWSDDLNSKLTGSKYIVYPGADHNMMPLWNQAAADTVGFFKSKLASKEELL